MHGEAMLGNAGMMKKIVLELLFLEYHIHIKSVFSLFPNCLQTLQQPMMATTMLIKKLEY
jgi:hypothetical protein